LLAARRKNGLLRRFAPLRKRFPFVAGNDDSQIIVLTLRSSSPAHAEDPVRRGFSVQSLASLEYWIARRSLSSGAHSRDPLAGDDD
jgi:hypothetical protein